MNNAFLEDQSEYFGGCVGEGRNRYHLSSHMEAVTLGCHVVKTSVRAEAAGKDRKRRQKTV